MADTSLAVDLFDFIQKVVCCDFCKRLYQSPRVLPFCCHTFCLDCIKSNVQRDEVKEHDVVKCPQCLGVSKLPPGKHLDSILKNYLVEKLLEIARYVRTIDHANIKRVNIIDFINRMRDITECPVCFEIFSEPRMLPCAHTFCTTCLKRSSSNNIWNPSTCPLCRQMFEIPGVDFGVLPRNDILDKIMNKLSEPEVQQLFTIVLDPDCVPESDREVTGVTELDGVMYVLFSKQKLIRFYQTEHPFSMISIITLDRNTIPSDITSSEQDKCLFVTDLAGIGSVWRIQAEEKVVEYTVHSVGQIAKENDSVTVLDGPAANIEPHTPISNVGNPPSSVEDSCPASEAVPSSSMSVPADNAHSSCDTVSEFLARFVNATRNRTSKASSESTGPSSPCRGASDEKPQEPKRSSAPFSGQASFPGALLDTPESLQQLIHAVMAQGLGKNSTGCQQATIVDHRIELWIEGVQSTGASVGPNQQLLLVTESGDLHIYSTASRQLIARHVLPADVQKPRHAVVNYKNGNFVVSHSAPDGSIHRVSELSLDPITQRLQVTRCYGSTPGQQVGHLHWPRHVAADARGYFFVADCSNNRVLLLDDKLQIKRVLLSHHDNIQLPWRLTLMPKLGLLVVGSVTGSVQIYDIGRPVKSKRK